MRKKPSLIPVLFLPLELAAAACFFLCALIARMVPKKIDFGLGPTPLVNLSHHKKVFISLGYSAETFVYKVWHITSEFDYRSDKIWGSKLPVFGNYISSFLLAVFVLFRYRCILLYFNGGPIGVYNGYILWRIEPLILSIAGIKTILIPFGSDIQVISQSSNLFFKDAISKDYPNHRLLHDLITKKINLWTNFSDHVISGCEWVDYMHHWDTLMISHFAIDNKTWTARTKIQQEPSSCLRLLHAPNHRNLKGTYYIQKAIKQLQSEGLDIELTLVEKQTNEKIRELIEATDLVIDQLIIGWYAMFAIEAMSLGKPVICYLRDDLMSLYKASDLFLCKLPIINANVFSLKDVVKEIYFNRELLESSGRDGVNYVHHHHSLEAIGKVFGRIAADLVGPPLTKSEK